MASRCGVLRNNQNPLEYDSKSFTMVNHCFRFQTFLMTDIDKGQYLMPLHCHLHHNSGRLRVVLRLTKTGTGFVRHQTQQMSVFSMSSTSWDPRPRTLMIPKVLRQADLVGVRRRFHDAFQFRVSVSRDWEHKFSATVPEHWAETPGGTPWDASTGRYMTNRYDKFTGMLTGTVYEERPSYVDKQAQFLLFFGFDGANIPGRRSSFKRETWIALSRSDASSYIETFKPKAVHLYDLPDSVLEQQHRMHYLRFTSYAGQHFSKGLGPTNKELRQGLKSRTRVSAEERDWPNEWGRVKADGLQLRTGLPYEELDMAIFARLETLQAGDYTTHRVHITIERMSESPQLHQTIHVFDADGQPRTLPEHHRGPRCLMGDDTQPPGASSPEPLPEAPLSSPDLVPATATPNTPRDQTPHTDTATPTTQTSPAASAPARPPVSASLPPPSPGPNTHAPAAPCGNALTTPRPSSTPDPPAPALPASANATTSPLLPPAIPTPPPKTASTHSPTRSPSSAPPMPCPAVAHVGHGEAHARAQRAVVSLGLEEWEG